MIPIDNKVIKCANEVIESLSEYNTNELRILYGVLYKLSSQIATKTAQGRDIDDPDVMEITEEDDDGNLCLKTRITLEYLRELTQKSNLSLKEIEETIVQLLSKKVKIKERDRNTYHIINIFSSCTVDRDKQTYEVFLNGKFTPYLIDLTGTFTLWELNEATSLSSKYGHALYLLGMQYQKIHKWEMKIPSLYEYFKISSGYRLYDVEKTLKAAIKEIENRTRLRIAYKREKKSNRVIALIFNFKYDGDLYKKIYYI